ncbi:hypothetical protein BN8_04283 [Fibrisoma limi BUZ 3]|uniref:DUF4397 domain-containing protein n=1 Tax=Fibrisoma limi BUZ 3 TaxID=1185876 RepID=I2GMC4_9BACT|nr:DUF4397 domain-containing protein [Fibrisoma limi]CCH55051.1 hypothetical protein BN8_04283 [Fibrisoma limi BUZ 3]
MTYRFFSVIALSVAALIGWSCEKNALILPNEPVTSGARIKLVHAALEAPGVDLFVNGTKLSAFTPANASTTSPGTPVPISFNNTFPGTGASYAVVPVGQAALQISAPATTTATSATVLYEQTTQLEDNKYYSLLLTGAGQKPDVLLVTDDFSNANDPSKFYVRFVNLIPNDVKYDLALSTGTVLVSGAAYKSVSPFVGVDVSNNVSLVLRAAGTTTNIGAVYTFTSTANGRVLTLFARGLPGKTGTQAPALNGYVNR